MLAKQGVMIVKLDLSNCNIGGLGADKLGQEIYNGSNLRTLQHLNLSNNNIDDSGIYSFGNCTGGTPSLRTLDLSNNLLTDNGANSLSWSFKKHNFYYLKHLDISGNGITDKGIKTLNSGLNSGDSTIGTVITLEKHNTSNGVLNFIKKAFNYYSEEISNKLQDNEKAALAIYGDNNWAHCKKLLHNSNMTLQVGIAQYTNQHLVKQVLQKSPTPLKKAITGAIVIASAKDVAMNVDVENLVYCLTAVNELLYGAGQYDSNDPGSSLIFMGENGFEDFY